MTELNKPWRLFVAVPLPTSLKEEMNAWVRSQREELHFRKWVHPQDYHITVQFLGDTPVNRIDELKESLTRAVEGVKPFELEAAGLGTFGRPASPSILWAGVRGDLSSLARLHDQVVKSNQALGYIPEERSFHPHITIARKYRENMRMNRERIQSDTPVFGRWMADSLVVYRTHMQKDPMYEPVVTICL